MCVCLCFRTLRIRPYKVDGVCVACRGLSILCADYVAYVWRVFSYLCMCLGCGDLVSGCKLYCERKRGVTGVALRLRATDGKAASNNKCQNVQHLHKTNANGAKHYVAHRTPKGLPRGTSGPYPGNVLTPRT